MDPTKPFSGKMLREIRKEAGLTQKELADRIHISRETVIAIEGESPGSINALQMDTLRRWWRVCDNRISEQSRDNFISYVRSFLRI